MNTSSATLYPMMAVGAFMTMFWSGVVVGHELGLSCFPLLAAGLLSGCIATIGVAELERRDRQGNPERRPGELSRAPGTNVSSGSVPARPASRPLTVSTSGAVAGFAVDHR